MANVPYERQTFDNPNPLARFAHRARFAKSKKLAVEFMDNDSLVVDYGSGQGRFLSELNREKASKRVGERVRLYGYDPYMASKFEGYEVIADLRLIETGSVTLMTSLETCEHLDEAETKSFLEFAERALASGGHLLVTVPIMIGPAILLKEASRSILFRRRPDIGMKDLFLAAVLGIVPPRAIDIKQSHRGYDWQKTYKLLSSAFSLERLEFSPIPFIGWFGNSQAIMVFRK
jgi:hypothetical protein